MFQVGKLETDLSAGASSTRRGGVLEFNFGIKNRLVRKLVAEIENGAEKIQFVLRSRSGSVILVTVEVLVDDFAVSAECWPSQGAPVTSTTSCR